MLIVCISHWLIPIRVAWIDLYANLQHIYSNIFIEYVAKNPLYHFNGEDPIDNPLFATKVEEYLMSLPVPK